MTSSENLDGNSAELPDAELPDAALPDAPPPDAAPIGAASSGVAAEAVPRARPAAVGAGGSARDAVDEAVASARYAAEAAGVSVREVTELRDLERVVRLLARIWGRDANPPMSLELLRALDKAGNYVGGAFVADELVGACVGFFHAPAEDTLHSHIAGVSPELVGRHVGFALKLHQRAWTMCRGVDQITWTFDPLVSRNAFFNIVKLAARPVEYLPNFYGLMADGVNRSSDTDRLLVHWPLRDPAVAAACGRAGGGTAPPRPPSGPYPAPGPAAGPAADAVVALGIAADGSPEPGRLDGATSLVAVPPDITGLRGTDPVLAGRWRGAVREAMTALPAQGATVVGFDRTGGYVLRRNR
ncbi:GNAT family N-acetyltransferase [Micromonospora sp. WMMD1102]|uniref:GNAT family N-acetyltransferase n=1 Tax=Micromonospora sp. WMMD1102 TaxID=3016105 RepID=UPI002415904D|nr:GNAT family N-acetyltransferase [Micromonospora sp. WMMD1102]MDG4785071.1 GNAT family N-acetyltransferase [Micromonospora sp. WMMD1102]